MQESGRGTWCTFWRLLASPWPVTVRMARIQRKKRNKKRLRSFPLLFFILRLCNVVASKSCFYYLILANNGILSLMVLVAVPYLSLSEMVSSVVIVVS